MEIQGLIRAMADDIFDEVVGLRRHIHANPELSFYEYETAAFVRSQLEKWGIEVMPEVANTGLVGFIRGKEDGKTIALRADMDALPIQEKNEVDYRSKNDGVMHACGHDVHTSSLLGTARILSSLKDKFNGTIKLIFQPAEERMPGGASLMIKEGVLEAPKVSAIYGQHVQPYLDAGKIGIRSGKYMASADEIHMRIKGKGGHAAHPRHFIDPVVITAQILVSLQQVVSRFGDPRIPSILSIGKMIADGATNVIPDEVRLEGTFRTMDEAWRAEALQKIEDISTSIAKSMGGEAEVEIIHGYPVLFNDEALTGIAKDRISQFVGEENVVELDLWMAAEDFAWYTQEVPGCFYRIGTRNEAKGIVHGLHTPHFNIDEDVLKMSTGLMAWLAFSELRGDQV